MNSNEIAAQQLAEIRNFKGKYPKQLWFLFFSEMWERFCFYGMRGVLTIFMIEQLSMAQREANLKYGAIQAFVYTMTFVGGFFADKLLGFRKSIFWGGILMIVGSFVIAFAPGDLFYIGTSISIVGTGFFKPNISGVVGLLYNDGDKRRDAGFSLFYSGINIGALGGGYLCFNLGDRFGWEWAFISTGIAMILGLVIFGFGMNSLGPLGFSPLQKEGGMSPARANLIQIAVYIGSLVMIPFILILVQNSAYTDMFMYIVGPAALLYLVYEMTRCTRAEVLKLSAAMVFILFSVFFWAFFEQSGGSLAIVARQHVTDNLVGLRIDPNEVNNAANSLFVIILSPLLGLLWLWLNARKAEPNTVVKFGLGFIFLAGAFYVFHSLIGSANAAGVGSLAVFTFAYLVITIGELCLSPIGLSAMTKLSPKRLFGIIMGLWFLASAYGQYIAGVLGAGMASSGEYRIEAKGASPAVENFLTITWADTSKTAGNIEKMDLYVAKKLDEKADTLKWQPLGTSNVSVQVTPAGDTVKWSYAGTANDGSEAVTLPRSLATAKDVEWSIEPVSIERLKLYTDGYLQLTWYALVCGVVLIGISPLVRRLMGEVK
jgi:proton-dependent oligopeptide transporter, POT family